MDGFSELLTAAVTSHGDKNNTKLTITFQFQFYNSLNLQELCFTPFYVATFKAWVTNLFETVSYFLCTDQCEGLLV